jgi:hypothetical protein
MSGCLIRRTVGLLLPPCEFLINMDSIFEGSEIKYIDTVVTLFSRVVTDVFRSVF